MQGVTDPLSSGALVLLLAQLAALLLTARVLAEGMRRVGQPQVLGELLAGILLGPTIVGHFTPQLFGALFPAGGPTQLLELIAWLGMLLLLFLTGVETDVRAIRSLGRPALMASLLGMVVPFGSGYVLGLLLPDVFLTDPADRHLFAAFLATAMAISALPVIAKILMDLGLVRRNVGLVILSAAVVDDTTGWVLLSLIAGIASGGTFSAMAFGTTLLWLSLFLAAMRWLAYPVLSRAVRFVNEHVRLRGADLTLIVTFAFLAAAATEALGVHALLGAFASGLVVRQIPRLKSSSLEALEGFVLAVLAPVFFAFVGLKVDLWSLSGWAMPLVVLAVAIGGKVIGCYLGGRLGHLSHWESLALGFGMNARGAMELVVALIGLSLGLLTREVYAAIVLVAVVTSFMAPLLLRWVAPRLPLGDDERRRLEDDRRSSLIPRTPLRILVPTAGGTNAMGAIRLAAPLARRLNGELTALYVASERAPGAWPWPRRPSVAGTGLEEHLRRAAALVGKGHFVVKQATATDIAGAMIEEAARDYDLVFLGAAPTRALDGPLARRVIRDSPIPVVILQNRAAHGDDETFERILVPMDGSVLSRFATELALAYADEVSATVHVLHVVPEDANAGDAEAELQAQLQYLGSYTTARLSVRVVHHPRPAELIIGESQSGHYDLLVIGAETRLLGRPALFGRGTAEIVERARCSTAVVLPGPL